jgi:PST family polysaccharide transporter
MYSLFTRIGALQLLGGLIYFLRTKVLALVLGPAGVGVVSIIDQFVQLMLQLSAFAVPFAAIKVLSKAHSENSETFRATYASLLRLLLILGSVGAALGIGVIALRPRWASASLASHAALVTIGLLALPAMILHAFFRNVPAAALQPLTSALWDVATAAIMTGFVIAGVMSFSMLGYFIGALAGSVVLSLSYYDYFARRFGLSIALPSGSLRELLKLNSSLIKLSLASYIGSFVTPLALFVVRATVLQNYGAPAAGHLQAAMGISLTINLVLNPLNGLILIPLVNRTLGQHAKHREAEEFQKRLLLAIGIVALPPMLYPDLVVVILYSHQFLEAADTLYWFVLSQAVMQIGGVYNALMIGLDRLWGYAVVMFVGTAANAGLAILLVPSLGLLGAGIAAFTSASLLAFGSFGYLHLREGFAIGRTTGLGTLFLVIGLGFAGALVGTRSSLEVPNLLAKSLLCIAGLGFVLSLSLGRDQRRGIREWLSAAFGRG